MLRRAFQHGASEGLAKYGLARPSLASVGISAPIKAPGLPSPSTVPKTPNAPATSLGLQAAKVAANVGMGTSTSGNGAGAHPGEPADTGRRQRSVVDRAFQQNEDSASTSSMPLPGAMVSP